MYKRALVSGAFFAALAVILGAFGAHALKEKLSPEMLQAFETGVRYQFYHAFALLITGVIYQAYPVKSLKYAAIFFSSGIALFSGSLYAMGALSINGMSIGAAGIITPIGGLFFILGWVMLLVGIVRKAA